MEHGIVEGHFAAIWSIAWVDDYLVSGSSDGSLKVVERGMRAATRTAQEASRVWV
jgi:hypothetical protein